MLHRIVCSSFQQIVRSTYLLHYKNRHAIYRTANRFYSKGSSKDDCPEKKVKNCYSKKPSDPCKVSKHKPCVPCPSTNRFGPLKCVQGSKMDQIPVPACPYDKHQADQEKKYLKHLIIGVLFTAVSLAALWYSLRLTKPEEDSEDELRAKGLRVYKRPKPVCKVPKNPSAIPTEVPYLLIGGGTASFSAFRAIKSSDPTAKVLVVSNECYFPYMRPPLSKEVWYNLSDDNVKNLTFKQWNGTERSLFYEPEDFYLPLNQLMENPNGGVALIQGYKVTKINVDEKLAYLDSNTKIKYDKCLIATGARPKNLDVFEKASDAIKEKVTLFRDIFDYQELSEISNSVKDIAIVGGGFLGSELACSLGKVGTIKGIKIHQIFKESGNLGKILPEYLSEWTTKKVEKEGVNVISRTELEDVTINTKDGRLILHLNNGKKLSVDHVIVAIGVRPNDELAKPSNLEVDPEFGGFLVNAEMEARSNLYVAGDCSCFYDVKLGRRRVEHHDHAVVTGRLAGENMTGATKPYLHQSMFWSDLGPNVGFEAIGHVDSKLPTVAVFAKATDRDNPRTAVETSNTNLRSEATYAAKAKTIDAMPKQLVSNEQCGPDYGKGVIFYLRNDIVVGIVLWNVFNRMSTARQVLKDEKKYDDLNEVAKLFNIHED